MASATSSQVEDNLAAIRAAVAYRDGHDLSTAQRDALHHYHSWGSLSQVFDESREEYADVRAQLRELLDDDEYVAARRTVTTAFYTPPEIVSSVWDGLNAAGFSGGRVLEPGVGTGGFIARAPQGTHMVGVERDPMSALIANARFPNAQIRREDFAKTDVPDSTFTATVGNVPFSQIAPYDPRHNRAGLATHNYFISKSIDLTSPGGYVAVVTSQHSADSAGRGATTVQEALTDRADFITGVRLPGGSTGAFADYAGTEVGTDVLVFRKRDDGQEPTERTYQFRRKQSVSVDGQDKAINAFFADNPDHVLGRYESVSTQFGPDLQVRSTGDEPLGERLSRVLRDDIAAAREQGYGLTASSESTVADSDVDVAGLVESSQQRMQQTIGTVRYTEHGNGDITFQQLQARGRQPAEWQDVKCAKKYQAEWKQLIDLRDTTEAVLDAARSGDEQALIPLREQLNEQYDTYVEHHGPINRFTLARPRPKRPERIQSDFEKLADTWRKHNGVDDRPFEGELPAEVTEALWDEASQPAGREQKKQLHLRGAIKTDPYMNAVKALEEFDDETQTADKGPWFSSNPLRSVDVPTSADTAADAVIIANTHGRPMTVEAFADLLGDDDHDRVAAQLEDQQLAFRHPHRPDEWIPAVSYLSGSIRPKLEVARELAAEDSRFESNVRALEDAMPERVTSGITMSLGANWIPTDIYREFIGNALGIDDHQRTEIGLAHKADQWSLTVPDWWDGKDDADQQWGVRAANAAGSFNFQDKNFASESHMGIAHRGYDATVYSAVQNIEDTMNMKPPELMLSAAAKEKRGYGEHASVVHRSASAFAGTKSEALQRQFSTFLTDHPEHYDRLVDIYNEKFNSVVAPHYDGSQRDIDGLSSQFKPYPYQLNAVERMLHEPGTLLNHVVGAGKTGSMLMGAMEAKRLGVARQPWMVVPNHLVEQIGIEAKQWFPGANMLVEQLDAPGSRKDQRQQMLAQASTTDWDLVLVSQSSFAEMSMSAEFLERYRDEVIEKYDADITELAAMDDDHQSTVKNLEDKRDAFERNMDARIESIRRADTIHWDEAPGDYLIVDEAHHYKNLHRASHLADLAEAGSARAMDMDVKLRYLREQKGSSHPVACFATGTPIANSIAELHTMMHYLRPDLLEEAGLSGVNSWAHNFTAKKTEIGFTAGNKIKSQTRIAAYENLAELAQMAAPMADTVTRDDIPRELPTMKGGETQVVEFDIDQESKDFIADLSWREDHRPYNPRVDNALKIMTDGQNATLAPELAGLPPAADGTGRVHAVAETVLAEWEDNRDNEYLDQQGNTSPRKGGLQVVFCDKGVPKSDGSFSIYEALRDELAARGMDKDRIRFIHEWDNNRSQLFDDCNNGKVDVLIANTAKLGTGANIQSRAVAIHHVDVPWKPADLEQQDGRVFRQGNQNQEVSRYTYVGRGTYDAHSWATIERKSQFINSFWDADRSMRSMQPLEDSDMDAMAQNKAIATGNPDFVAKAELSKKVEKLQAAADEHVALAVSRTRQRDDARRTIETLGTRIERVEPLADRAEQWSETALEKRHWNFGGGDQPSRDKAVEAMTNRLYDIFRSGDRNYQPVGEIGGVPFRARFTAMGSVEVSGPFGPVNADEIPKYVVDSSYAHSGISPKEISSKRQGLLSRMENQVKTTGARIDDLYAQRDGAQRTIDEIDNAPEAGDFPQQDELDTAKSELRAVNTRLAQFDASDAEKKRKKAYNQRMADKGRSPGYSLELNPTGFMKSEGMVCHPDSKPIKPPARTEQSSLIAQLGMDGPPNLSQCNDSVERPDTAPQHSANDHDDGMYM